MQDVTNEWPHKNFRSNQLACVGVVAAVDQLSGSAVDTVARHHTLPVTPGRPLLRPFLCLTPAPLAAQVYRSSTIDLISLSPGALGYNMIRGLRGGLALALALAVLGAVSANVKNS